jgi:hypothetical protein
MGTHHMGNTAAATAVPLVSALLLAAFVAVPLPVSAQNPAPGEKSAKQGRAVSSEELEKAYLQLAEAKLPTPRTADGHPDLSGFYYNPLDITVKRDADGNIYYAFGETRTDAPPPRYPEPNEPTYKPEYEAKVKAILERQYGTTSQDDPNFDCTPSGVPRASTGPMQIVQTPKTIVILYESNFIGQTFRIIYTDGKPHPKDLDTSYMGDSVGHWEGNTLVVDVVSLDDSTWLGGAQGHTEPGAFGEPKNHQIIEKSALIHSDQEHVVERYTRRGNMLVYEATVEDPVMFTKPWVLTPRHLLLRNDRFLETFCTPSSTDKTHMVLPSQQDQFQQDDERFHRPEPAPK